MVCALFVLTAGAKEHAAARTAALQTREHSLPDSDTSEGSDLVGVEVLLPDCAELGPIADGTLRPNHTSRTTTSPAPVGAIMEQRGASAVAGCPGHLSGQTVDPAGFTGELTVLESAAGGAPSLAAAAAAVPQTTPAGAAPLLPAIAAAAALPTAAPAVVHANLAAAATVGGQGSHNLAPKAFSTIRR